MPSVVYAMSGEGITRKRQTEVEKCNNYMPQKYTEKYYLA